MDGIAVGIRSGAALEEARSFGHELLIGSQLNDIVMGVFFDRCLQHRQRTRMATCQHQQFGRTQAKRLGVAVGGRWRVRRGSVRCNEFAIFLTEKQRTIRLENVDANRWTTNRMLKRVNQQRMCFDFF